MVTSSRRAGTGPTAIMIEVLSAPARWHSRPSLLRSRVLCESFGGLVEACAGRLADLRARVDHLLAGARDQARLVRVAAVLSRVAHEGQRLGPALDFRCDDPHPLRGRGAHAAAVVPGAAVPRRPRGLVRLRGHGKLRVALDLALEDRLALGLQAERGPAEGERQARASPLLLSWLFHNLPGPTFRQFQPLS